MRPSLRRLAAAAAVVAAFMAAGARARAQPEAPANRPAAGDTEPPGGGGDGAGTDGGEPQRQGSDTSYGPRSEEAESLTTEQWRRPDVPSGLGWDLLRLPEFAVRLTLSPLLPLVAWAQDVRLEQRIIYLVTNEEGTRLFVPTISVANRDGTGVGFLYNHSNLFGGEEEATATGRLMTNGDYGVAATYGERIVPLEGRMLRGDFEYELNQNERWYGIGNRTTLSDERVISRRAAIVGAEYELGGPRTDLASFHSDLRLGYRNENVASGRDANNVSFRPGGSVETPPGYDATNDYFEAQWNIEQDLRDSEGRTRRGFVLFSELDVTSDLAGNNLSGAKLTGIGTFFLPVAPVHRTLVLSLGTAATTPWAPDHEVPLHNLVTLGRSNYLRGYARRRFRDRTGAWASAEYRYPVLEFRDTGAALTSTLFVDVGKVARTYEGLDQGKLRTSYGFGFRAETSVAFVFRGQVGFSEEGIEFTLSLNEAFE